MTVKQKLKRYKSLYYEFWRLKAIYDSMELPSKSVTDYDGLPHGDNNGNPVEQYAIRRADARLQYLGKYNEALNELLEIETMIQSIEDEKMRAIIFMNYVGDEDIPLQRPMTIREIAKKLGYSTRRIMQLKAQAISEIERRYGNDL